MNNETETICQNCSHINFSSYCSECGQRTGTKRLDTKWLLENLGEAWLHFERNHLFHTLRQMLVDPGSVVLDYINGRRVTYHPPLTYLLLSAIVYKLLAIWIMERNHWESGRFAYMQPHELFFAFGMISILAYLLLLRPKYNLLEAIVAVCYIYGTVFLLVPIMAILIQMIFPAIALEVPDKFRPFVVDGWIILLSIYMAMRVSIKMQVSILKLVLVIALTIPFYIFREKLPWYPKSESATFDYFFTPTVINFKPKPLRGLPPFQISNLSFGYS